jgi:hypothetical protein
MCGNCDIAGQAFAPGILRVVRMGSSRPISLVSSGVDRINLRYYGLYGHRTVEHALATNLRRPCQLRSALP